MEHKVGVLVGDFNMSFMVIPGLRSRGATIDLAAWYPWKTSLGTPCADSCDIFCLRKPGVFKLEVGLPDLHNDNETGFRWTWSCIGKTPSPAVAVEVEVEGCTPV